MRYGFKDECGIMRYTETQSGNGEMIKAWKTIKTVKAFVNDYSGGMRIIDDKKGVSSTGFALFELGTDIAESDRVYCITTSRLYDVVYVKPSTESVRERQVRVELRYV